jgi:hypothetical protein
MRRAAIRRGTRNPVWRLDRRFAKIRSAAKLAASSGLWRQPTLFGIHIVPRADWTTFVMRLETSNEGEGKKSLPRADDLSPGGACLRPWANQSDVALRATIPANTGGRHATGIAALGVNRKRSPASSERTDHDSFDFRGVQKHKAGGR